jgi:phosphatidylserine/phosphatidylglycerophosphate/cardiolipin synthase-like enzyme
MKNWKLGGLLVAVALAACSGGSAGFGSDGGTTGNGSSSGSSSGSGSGGGNGGDGGGPSGSGGDGGGTSSSGGDSGKQNGVDAGPAFVGSSNVQIIVEPEGNDGSDVAAAISSAKHSVHMTMYLLDNEDCVNALVAQAKAGLDVKVVLNQVFPSGTTSSNPTTFTTLQNAGVGIVWANSTRFTYTHEKTFILDGTTAWIMNMNLDETSPNDNREYLVVDNEAADVAEAEQIFEADYANTAITAPNPNGPLDVAPEPPNNARSLMTALIASAKTSLDIEDEEFSDYGSSGSGVTPAVVAAAKRGVKVRLVLSTDTPEAAQTESISDVKAAGGSVVVSGAQSGSGNASNPYIHAKAILVDCAANTCAAGFIGSENMTGGSLGYNRELGVIVTNGTELWKVETAISTDFANGTAQ